MVWWPVEQYGAAVIYLNGRFCCGGAQRQTVSGQRYVRAWGQQNHNYQERRQRQCSCTYGQCSRDPPALHVEIFRGLAIREGNGRGRLQSGWWGSLRQSVPELEAEQDG